MPTITKRPASSMSPSSTTSSSSTLPGPPQKKLASIFQPPSQNPFKLVYLTHSTPGKCLYGASPPGKEPVRSRKIAAFDLDGTLIETLKGNAIAAHVNDCKEWTRKGMPEGGVRRKLKELVKDGYAIVLFSNQKLTKAQLEIYHDKVRIHVSDKYGPEIPFQLFAATDADEYRKPAVGMWEAFIKGVDGKGRVGRSEKVDVDFEESFFVGDAAGRGEKKFGGDHSDSDRKFAENIPLRFYTPEDYFIGDKSLNWKMRNDPTKWDPKKYDHDQPLFLPSNTPLVPLVKPGSKPPLEVVIFVGSPGVGKTSLFKKYFEPKGYVHINQDTLKTRTACLSLLRASLLSPTPKSCVIDNTNPSKSVRAEYISLLSSEFPGVKVRAFEWDKETHWNVARQNSVWRALGGGGGGGGGEGESRQVLPSIAFFTWEKNWEKVTKDEGFDEIKSMRFRFEGTGEEKRKWERWSNIYGKMPVGKA